MDCAQWHDQWWPPVDFRARFLKMWGPDAFQSQIPVTELFDELRRQRER